MKKKKTEEQESQELQTNDSHMQDDLRRKCEEYENGWRRALADYENLKREMDARLSESRNRIKADFAELLLPVMDNFQEALRHAPQNPDASTQNWLSGIEFIKKQFEDVFASLGLEPIPTVGTTFNAHLHEAVKEDHDEAKADQEILQEISAGWKMNERVLRSAKVVVNKKDLPHSFQL